MLSKTRFKTLCGSAILGCMTALTTPVMATNDAMLELIDIMQRKGTLTSEEAKLLRNAALADSEKSEAAAQEAKKIAEDAASELPKITTKGKLKIESADGKHSFQPIGRIFWDSIWEDNDESARIAGGSELRRARLGFEAQFFKNWKAKLEYDFAGSDADLKDAWISYNNKISNGVGYTLKVGQHHLPFGFNTTSSSKYMSFMRRPLFADQQMSPARQYGASVLIHHPDYRWSFQLGGYLDEPEDGEVNRDGDQEDSRTFALRLAGTPIYMDNTHLLHLGGSYMNFDARGDAFRLRQRAITHIDHGRMFDTGTFAAGDIDDADAFDLEALVIYGPVHVLGEYVDWSLDNNGATTTGEDFSGWSIEAGWFLTGESMVYKKTYFSGVKPRNNFSLDGSGWGAWQIAVRYENLDYNDGTTIGGDGDVFSAGLNWNPIKNVRFMATYNKLVDFDRPGDADDSKEPAAFSVRSLVYW